MEALFTIPWELDVFGLASMTCMLVGTKGWGKLMPHQWKKDYVHANPFSSTESLIKPLFPRGMVINSTL
jgi:hypothetical protein